MAKISFKRLAVPFLVILAGYIVYLYLQPVPPVQPISRILPTPKTQAIDLPWPAAGQAAIGAVGYGTLASHNVDTPRSIASIAKVITALAVLEQKPITPGGEVPNITLDKTDVDYFNYYYANDGSVVEVVDGEKISEYQALQAMLLPSSNNMGDSLARWAFGSPANYVAYANKMVAGMGLTHTKVGNTNGFDDTTTSTADDLVVLGIKALQNPVIAEIVGQKTAALPQAGEVKNVNWLLGTNGVSGIKTGNTEKAGGCYLFSAKRQAGGHLITVVGAVIGSADLTSAISAAPPLLSAADSGFEQVKVVTKDQVLAEYQLPWGGNVQLHPSKDMDLLAWKGAQIKIVNKLEPIKAPLSRGSSVGSTSVVSGALSVSSPLKLNQAVPGPSWHWRIFRL